MNKFSSFIIVILFLSLFNNAYSGLQGDSSLFHNKWFGIKHNLSLNNSSRCINKDVFSICFPETKKYNSCESKAISFSDNGREVFGSILKDSMIEINSNNEFVPKWHEMITNIPNDLWKFCEEYINKENLPMILALTVGTAGLIATDDGTWKISDNLYKQNNFHKSWSDFFTEFGDGRTQFALAAGFGLLGFIDNDKRALRTASQIVEGVLSCGFVVQILKHMTGRESPFVATQPGGLWRFFPNQIEYHKKVPHYDAYPSGHIATSVATFVIIAENYPEHKWIKPVSYVLSTLIMAGMANKGIHWYSDYPLGIALGYAFGKMISNQGALEKPLKTDNILEKIRINPVLGNNTMGLSFSLGF